MLSGYAEYIFNIPAFLCLIHFNKEILGRRPACACAKHNMLKLKQKQQ